MPSNYLNCKESNWYDRNGCISNEADTSKTDPSLLAMNNFAFVSGIKPASRVERDI
jgi:hypothetical protein